MHGYPERDEKIRRTVAVRKSTVEDLERLRSCYDIKRTEINFIMEKGYWSQAIQDSKAHAGAYPYTGRRQVTGYA